MEKIVFDIKEKHTDQVSDRQGVRDCPLSLSLKFLHIPRTCRTVKSESTGTMISSDYTARGRFRGTLLFFSDAGAPQGTYMDFRAHLTQSSVMTIGFGASVGALRRRSSARVLITVSKLRASSLLQYSIPPRFPSYTHERRILF